MEYKKYKYTAPHRLEMLERREEGEQWHTYVK